jgi:hypothetical protein
MRIETEFDPGDVVFHVRKTTRPTRERCPSCGGNGRMTGMDGERVVCPTCYGRRTVVTGNEETRVVDGPLTIAEVRVLERPEHREGEDSEFANYGHVEPRREETYMCRETGVGTGTIYRVENLFFTREAAEEAAAAS